MTAKTNNPVEAPKGDSSKRPASPVFRETIESFCVALILAFLFRAFVAEAFVIPTGSMAPTLMGAHKDIRCSECGCDYQSNGSQEVDESGNFKMDVVIGTTCPLCRYTMPMDLRNNANHKTFSGDRILVSKFAYLLNKPNRWDVIVFKYPHEAKTNYIKRLIGRPNESIRIQYGDIYIKGGESERFEIARKPPNVLNAMLQPVYDSDHLSKSLVSAGMPSAWQPLADAASESAWTIQQDSKQWRATFDASKNTTGRPSWIRYHHRVIDPQVWDYLRQNDKFPGPIDAKPSRLISDFTSYNASVLAPRSAVYDSKRRLLPKFDETNRFMSTMQNVENDGLHWVGDLATEFEIKVNGDQGGILVDLVEAGVHHQCRIDVATGEAVLNLTRNGSSISALEDGKGGYVDRSVSETSLQGSGTYQLKFANVDDSLVLWVNGKPQSFAPSNRFDTQTIHGSSTPRPYYSSTDPLDAAPVGLGLEGVAVDVQRARVWRDVYYIATTGRGNNFTDYDVLDIAGSNLRADFGKQIASAYSTPSKWDKSPIFTDRRYKDFQLGDKQYFPMGDNSPQSSDGRVWPSQDFIPEERSLPERLLIGRAILVFWPHAWNRPIPFLPNVRRMGLIR